MKKLLFGALLLSIAAFFSCRKDQTPPISFSSMVLERQGGTDCEGEEGPCARLEMVYPLASGTTATQLVQMINDTLQQTLGQIILTLNPEGDSTLDLALLADQFVQSYTDFVAEVPNYELGWWIESSYEIHKNTAKFISIELMISSFTGGAHPIGFSETFNFSLPDSRAITLDSLIRDEEGFLALVEREFKLARGLPLSAVLQDEGFFYNESFSLPANFVFTEEGLYLIYNVYDVGPYALGPTEILIPYALLEGILDTNPGF